MSEAHDDVINLMSMRSGKIEVRTELNRFCFFLVGYAAGRDAMVAEWGIPESEVLREFQSTTGRWQRNPNKFPCRYLEFGSYRSDSPLMEAYDAYRRIYPFPE